MSEYHFGFLRYILSVLRSSGRTMYNLVCVVDGCNSRATWPEYTHEVVTFHRFPKKQLLKELWAHKILKVGWEPKPRSYVCSRHFTADSFVPNNNMKYRRLKRTAVPTLSLPKRRNMAPKTKKLAKIEIEYAALCRPDLHYGVPKMDSESSDSDEEEPSITYLEAAIDKSQALTKIIRAKVEEIKIEIASGKPSDNLPKQLSYLMALCNKRIVTLNTMVKIEETKVKLCGTFVAYENIRALLM